MYLIAGLGNPERKYEKTRHNVGFRAVDLLSEKRKIRVTTLKFRAMIGRGKIGSESVILAKPLTYMNLSGEAIRRLTDFFKIPHEKIIVISDDVYLEAGSLRIRASGSAGGHNGLENIISELGGSDFKRIRIGVGPQPQGVDLIRFVLEEITESEEKRIAPSIESAAEAAETIVSDGIEKAMNRFNGKKRNDQS